jgi:hypothetical protein
MSWLVRRPYTLAFDHDEVVITATTRWRAMTGQT